MGGVLEFLETLSRLIPPPRVHRHRYHGILDPNARLRARVVALGRGDPDTAEPAEGSPGTPGDETAVHAHEDPAASLTGAAARSRWARGGPDSAEQDPEHGAGENRVVVEEGADPLGDGEHPLAVRRPRQDLVVQVGGDLDHPPGVAGRADAAALAGEGHEALGGAVVTTDAGEAVGEDAAAR
jgi:hypothetical protein